MSILKDKINFALSGHLARYSYENLIDIASCPDEFYKLVKEKKELVKFMNYINARYSKLNGIKPWNLLIKDLPKNIIGESRLDKEVIIINKKIVDLFPKALEKKNINFIAIIFSTIIHEAEHALQVEALKGKIKNLERKNDFMTRVIKLDQLLDKTVKFSKDPFNNLEANLQRQLDRMSKYFDPLSKYGNNPAEILAREAEIKFIRTLAEKSNQEEYSTILKGFEKKHVEFINNSRTNNFDIIELLERATKSDNKEIIKASNELIKFFEKEDGSNPVKNILEKNCKNDQESLDIHIDSLINGAENKDRKMRNINDKAENDILAKETYLDCFPITKNILEKFQNEQSR